MDLNKIFTKTNLVIASIVIAGLLILSTANLRSKLSTVRSELSAAKVTLTIVEGEKHRLDSLVTLHKATIIQLDKEIAKRDSKIAKDQRDLKALQDSLKTVQDNTIHVTADSSYRYIQLRIPFITELNYRFDSAQVKSIHYTFIERDGLFTLNNKKDLLIKDLNLSSYVKDNQIVELKSLGNVYISKYKILETEKTAQTVQIEGLNKAVKQQRRQKTILEAVTVGAVAIIVVKALLK